MIIDMRTYDYRPATCALGLEKIEFGLPERTTLSPLGGLWQAASGLGDRIVHIWPFADMADREHVRGQFKTLKNWPAGTGAYMAGSETKIVNPAPFSPPLTPRTPGPIYEIHTDTYFSGRLKQIVETWSHAMGDAIPASLIMAGNTELGPMNQWVHIWAYPTLQAWHDAAAAREAIATDNGQIDPATLFQKRERFLCTPASFSPLQ